MGINAKSSSIKHIIFGDTEPCLNFDCDGNDIIDFDVLENYVLQWIAAFPEANIAFLLEGIAEDGNPEVVNTWDYFRVFIQVQGKKLTFTNFDAEFEYWDCPEEF